MNKHLVKNLVVILLKVLHELNRITWYHNLDNLRKVPTESRIQALFWILSCRWLIQKAKKFINQGIVLLLFHGYRLLYLNTNLVEYGLQAVFYRRGGWLGAVRLLDSSLLLWGSKNVIGFVIWCNCFISVVDVVVLLGKVILHQLRGRVDKGLTLQVNCFLKLLLCCFIELVNAQVLPSFLAFGHVFLVGWHLRHVIFVYLHI